MAKIGLDYSAWTGPANDLKRRFDYQDPRTNSKIATIVLECKVETGALGPVTELSFMFSPFPVVDGMDLGLSIAPIDARHVPVGVRVLSADNRQGALMSPRTPQGSNLLLSHLLSGKPLKFGIFQGPEQLVDLPFYNDDEFAQLHRQATGTPGEKKSWFGRW